MKKASERKEYVLAHAKEIETEYRRGRYSADNAVGKLSTLQVMIRFEEFRDGEKLLKDVQAISDAIWKDIFKRDGKKTAEEMSRFVNGAGSAEIGRFVEQMGTEHRTLQQSFTNLCMSWFRNLAEMEQKGYYDGRNEASCKLAKKITEALKDDSTYLPLI